MRNYGLIAILAIALVSICTLSGCPDNKAVSAQVNLLDEKGNALPTLSVTTSAEEYMVDIVVGEGDYQCVGGKWGVKTSDVLACEAYYVVACTFGNETFYINDVQAGDVIEIFKPDYVACGWQGNYSGDSGYTFSAIWFDDSKIVATNDGQAMGYKDGYWSVI